MAAVRGHNVDVFRPDDYVNRLVFVEAFVYAGKGAAEELDQAVVQHHTVQDVTLTDEISDKRVFRFVVNILGPANLLDAAFVHDHNGVGHGQGFLLVVGHVYKSNPHGLLNAFEFVLHVFPQSQIQRTQGLVQKQHLGSVDQGAGNGDPLLLPAGQGGNFSVS